MDEAVSIIKQIPNAKVTYQEKDYIEWEYTSTKNDGGWLDAQNGIVNFIVLDSVQSNLTLETIVASYGEPKYVKSYDCNVEVTMCYIALIYPDLGLYVNIYKENEGKDAASPKFKISSNDMIDRLYFFKPGLENFPNLYNVQESEVPIPWKGFGKYP